MTRRPGGASPAASSSCSGWSSARSSSPRCRPRAGTVEGRHQRRRRLAPQARRGYVGHVNRVVGEVTAAVSVVRSRAPTTTSTRRGRHRRPRPHSGTVAVVDDSIERIANPAGLEFDGDTAVHAVEGGALIVGRGSMTVWKLDRGALVSVAATDEIEPIVTGEGSTASAATPDGHAVFVDQAPTTSSSSTGRRRPRPARR